MANILYYFGLYLIVIIIKVAKLLKDHENEKFSEYWRKLFEFSLDLTFAASGCIIALLLNVDKNWIPFIYVLSSIILLISTFMEFLTERYKNLRLGLNLFIITTIFIGTVYLYDNVIPKVDSNGQPISEVRHKTIKKFVVMIPYKDGSLISNFGYNKIGGRNFFAKYEIADSLKKSAREKAILLFWKDSTIVPLIKYSNQSNPIQMIQEEIIVVAQY